MPIEAANALTESQSRAATAGKNLTNDFSDFLTLLTTQLQHQDPLDPMDSGEFTSQLVAFAGVEQQIQTNQNLEQLAVLSQLNNIGNIAGYLGNEALIEAAFGDHDTDGVKWQYSNLDSADKLQIQVLDEDGTLVYEIAGETGIGLHDFNWDGLDNSGQLAAPGNYQLSIDALDSEGNTLTTGIAVQETITAVNTASTIPTFTIGPNTVEQTDILSLIRNP
ncbi:MAG: hypothetical protein JKY34_11330 [Kordiimonadaceae bacterium]|nr:hypothetical protein [Kordiimonadaceae bacterium]